MTLDDLLRARWSIRIETRNDDGFYFVATVDELPGLVATGATSQELGQSLREALESHLRSFIDAGEEPPMPAQYSQEVFFSFGSEQASVEAFGSKTSNLKVAHC